MRIADNKVNDGGQPPMTFRLALRESAGSRLLHHPVCAPYVASKESSWRVQSSEILPCLLSRFGLPVAIGVT